MTLVLDTRFERLLRDAIGLDAASVGATTVARAVTQRQRTCQILDADAYWAHVCTAADELQALIEATVVPETWFFRDPDAYAALTRWTRAWLRTHEDGTLRVLSLPCSTGDEPYSIVMTLLDAGLPASQFHVDAVDVSEQALAHAARGVYAKGAFRARDLRFRDRHFEPLSRGVYRVRDAVREPVRFLHGNVLKPDFLGARTYDAIFCRNLLIYFDRATQRRTAHVLARLLVRDGVLFVAAAEAGALFGTTFVPMAGASAGAFRHSDVEVPEHPVRPVTHRTVATAVVPRVHEPIVTPTSSTETTETNWLDKARGMADRGQLADATRCCEEQIRRHGPSAQTCHLLGLVSDARGDRPTAAAWYRKALYLDPRHEPSLVHLALLVDTDNPAEAERLRLRARRAARTEGAAR
jgi:chemotaxis protein methyltransferase WspC